MVDVDMECPRCKAPLDCWTYQQMRQGEKLRFLNGEGCPACDGKEKGECPSSE